LAPAFRHDSGVHGYDLGEISIEGSPPDPEVIDDITDKRVVHRVLEHRLGEANFLLVQHAWPPTRPVRL